LNRAALSIATNLAEGKGRFTEADLEEIARMLSGLINGLEKRST
jgi:hypothetical protein